jgi:hypothetical protein
MIAPKLFEDDFMTGKSFREGQKSKKVYENKKSGQLPVGQLPIHRE